MQRIAVERFIAGISDEDIKRYEEYLHSLRPRNYEDVFSRFVFAYCSIQTGWKANVALYNALRDPAWRSDVALLKKLIIDTRAGFHNNRARYLSDFSDKYWEERGPMRFQRAPGEDWVVYRNRIVGYMLGMGIAKVSFTLEMLFPLNAEVICLDRHLLRFYSHKGENCSQRKYEEYEAHWVKHCAKRKVAPAVARWIYWDKIQKKPDSSYWAYVLEHDTQVVH